MTMWWRIVCSSVVLALGVDANARAERQVDILTEWNEQLLKIAQDEDKFLTLKGVRAAAMMHAAMHDALNAIAPRFETYALERREPDADPLAAIAAAGYTIAVSQYPDQRAVFDALRGHWRARASSRSALNRGTALGIAAGEAILAMRAEDGWDRSVEYQWQPTGPGVYAAFHEHSGTPEGFVFGAGWAEVTPFVLQSPDQFRSPAPPPIDSDAYVRAFNEVKSLGAAGSTARTADQTRIAMWWKDFVENSHNRLARKLVRAEATELWAAARLFALLNMAIVDGYISSFYNKFEYNHWRPYTAIRSAEYDGNPGTIAAPEWNTAHRHTYAFPSYPSAHGTVCAAAMTMFADVFGDASSFTMDTPFVSAAGPMSDTIAMDPPSRSFVRFSQAAAECARSRVYLGIHFSYDSTAGTDLGEAVGRYIVANALEPTKAR